MSHPSPSPDTEHLRHEVRFLQLLVEEYRLRVKRMALRAVHFERLYKQAVKEDSHE